jgi:hypothetical protein
MSSSPEVNLSLFSETLSIAISCSAVINIRSSKRKYAVAKEHQKLLVANTLDLVFLSVSI